MGSVGTNVEALEVRIKELELENMSLKSQLDKYQTIFALQGETVGKQVTLAYMKIMVVDLWKRKFYIFSDKIFAGCNRNPNEEQEGGSRDGNLRRATIPQIPPGDDYIMLSSFSPFGIMLSVLYFVYIYFSLLDFGKPCIPHVSRMSYFAYWILGKYVEFFWVVRFVYLFFIQWYDD